MFIFFCIYAILAVELFRDFGCERPVANAANNASALDVSMAVGASSAADVWSGPVFCTASVYYTIDEQGRNVSVDATTGRGINVGREYYGTFMRALFTLFQVMTGESWSEAIARPLLFGFSSSLTTSAIVIGAFFTSFIILMQMVLINVVVAVLLDKFVDSPAPAEQEMEPQGGPADPDVGPAQLLSSLSEDPAQLLSSLSSPLFDSEAPPRSFSVTATNAAADAAAGPALEAVTERLDALAAAAHSSDAMLERMLQTVLQKVTALEDDVAAMRKELSAAKGKALA